MFGRPDGIDAPYWLMEKALFPFYGADWWIGGNFVKYTTKGNPLQNIIS
jgi:hypothetical protein